MFWLCIEIYTGMLLIVMDIDSKWLLPLAIQIAFQWTSYYKRWILKVIVVKLDKLSNVIKIVIDWEGNLFIKFIVLLQ
jgi:hypothetical protein